MLMLGCRVSKSADSFWNERDSDIVMNLACYRPGTKFLELNQSF